MTAADEHNLFRQAHQPLEAQLKAHLLAVIRGDFQQALQLLQHGLQQLQAHIDLEETHLFPHIPDNARWAARVYTLEHRRLRELGQDYLATVQAVAAHPGLSEDKRAGAALHVLDRAHALRHLLEHHHQREEQALAHELPLELQRRLLLARPDTP